jgi:hypothetical protein
MTLRPTRGSKRYGGGPFLVDAETAAASGLREGNIVVITTYNYQYPRGANQTYPVAALQQFAAIGIAESWRDPLVLADKMLYQFDAQNAAFGLCDGNCDRAACKCIPKNGSAGWRGWSMEGGELYFSKKVRRWRVIFHSFRKDFTLADELPYGIHSGGFAESRTANPLGDWTCYPPQVGAGYDKLVSAVGHEQVPRVPPPFSPADAPRAPFNFGKTNMSHPAYLNQSMETWGGNVHQTEDGKYHMMLAGFVHGAGLGGWEVDSQIVHAVSDRPEGPFAMQAVVLPTFNHNPHLLYDPTTKTYLLYSLGTGFGKCGGGMPAGRQCEAQYPGAQCIDGQCQGCHKGHCGPYPRQKPGPKIKLAVNSQGYVQLGRRERPKLLLDKHTGEPTMLYNGVGSVDGHVFTIATPMKADDGRARELTLGSGLPLRSARDLQAAISASISSGAASYTIAVGAYYFDDGTPLLLHRAKNWVLRAEPGGVELWFRLMSGTNLTTGGVLIKECENVAVSGLTVDYDPPAMYQGTVLGVDAVGSAAAEQAAAAVEKAACYLRADVELSSCKKAGGPDATALRTLERAAKRWTAHADTNCFPTAGAAYVPGAPEPWPCCSTAGGAKEPRLVTLAACEAACLSYRNCTAIVTGAYSAGPPHHPTTGLATMLVRTDPGYPEPHIYTRKHVPSHEPSDQGSPGIAIWAKSAGYSCNRTLGCPGHFPATLYPANSSLPKDVNRFDLLSTAQPGDKVTISIRKGLTWHVQNSTNVSTTDVVIHSSSLFGLSEFDGRGGHHYTNVYLGRRQYAQPLDMTDLCGRAPGRLCWSALVSSADAFHSSGCKFGAKLHNVTLSNNLDDFLNVHSRMQLLGDKLSPTELIILDPRMATASGEPNDVPYGGAETMPNAKRGDVLQFHAINTFAMHGEATVVSTERLTSQAIIEKYGKAVTAATDGSAPYRMHPSMGPGGFAPDIGQICQATSDKYHLPYRCQSRVWRVTLETPLPAAADLFDIVSLKGWDNAGLEVRDSKFFGGIDGVHSKSNGAVFVNNTMACTGFDVSPWQHYLEGPPHLGNMTITDNVFTACGGFYGAAYPSNGYIVNCSGLNNGGPTVLDFHCHSLIFTAFS